MLNIFLAYSSKDIDFVEEIIGILNLPSDRYYFLCFHRYQFSIDQIMEKIPTMDVFILLISINSLNSQYIKSEYIKATESESIKEICIIIINDIDMKQICDLFYYKSNYTFTAKTSYSAAVIIKDRITKCETCK